MDATDNTMRAELASCPFCGKSVACLTRSSEFFEEYWDGGNDDYHAVMCDAHMPGGPGGCGASGGFKRSEAEAIAAWNRRADTARVATALATGNTSTTVGSDFTGAKVTLRYETEAQAEEAAQAIAHLISPTDASQYSKPDRAPSE